MESQSSKFHNTLNVLRNDGKVEFCVKNQCRNTLRVFSLGKTNRIRDECENKMQHEHGRFNRIVALSDVYNLLR